MTNVQFCDQCAVSFGHVQFCDEYTLSVIHNNQYCGETNQLYKPSAATDYRLYMQQLRQRLVLRMNRPSFRHSRHCHVAKGNQPSSPELDLVLTAVKKEVS